MNRCYRMVPLMGFALALLMWFNAPAVAQEEDVKKDLQEIKKMLKKMQGDIDAIKKAKAQPTKRPTDTTVYDVKIGNSPIRGPASAPVTIVEFSEFQCPFCVREDPKIKQILKEFPNDVNLVFKHYPLSFHKKAKPAAAATVLAQNELGSDGFWQMHDKIMTGGTKKLEVTDLKGYAEELNMNLAAFDAVMADSAKQDELLKDDMAEAKKCKIRGTPTVLINGLKMTDRSLDGYRKRINEELKKKGKKTAGTN